MLGFILLFLDVLLNDFDCTQFFGNSTLDDAQIKASVDNVVSHLCILPGSVVAVYFGMFREDIGLSGDGYACFPSSYRPLSFLSLLIAPTLLYVGVTLLLYWQTMRSATELFAELRESGVWRVFQLNIQNNFLATISKRRS